MNHGYRKSVSGTANPSMAETAGSLPPDVNYISTQGENGWNTQVTCGGVHILNGLVMQSVYHNGVLSLGINNRRLNTVYRFDQNGALEINRLSAALTQESDVAFFICPSHPDKLYIRHEFLQKTFAVIGEVVAVQKHFEAAFAVLQEHTRIDCKSGDISQKVVIRSQYRALIDPINDLSTLVQQDGEKWEVLSVSDLKSGKHIYARRAFSKQSAASAVALHAAHKKTRR